MKVFIDETEWYPIFEVYDVDKWGEGLDESDIDINPELFERYRINLIEFKAIQKKLGDIYEKH